MAETSTRRVLIYSWAGVLAFVALYLGWTALSRRAPSRTAATPAPQAAAPDHGSSVKILQFYARDLEIANGESTLLCYGVANARTVSLEPAVEQLAPRLNRCFAVEPKATTTYRLTAEGIDGARVSQSVTVRLKPPSAAILFVQLSSTEVQSGQPVLLCYGTRHASSVRLEPALVPMVPSEKHCVQLRPAKTTAFTLVAAGPGGATDRERFTITVR